MCGRTFYNIDLDLLKKKFQCKKIIENEKLKKGIVNKNNYSPIIFQTHTKDDGESEKDNILCVCSWGINPMPFKKMDDKIVLINARFETLASKKTFSALIGKNRCAIVVNGFFEWKSVDKDSGKNSKSKLPYFIFCKTGFSLIDEDVQKEEKEKVKENVKREKLEEDEKENEKDNEKENMKEKDDEQENVDTSDNEPTLKKKKNDLTKNDAIKVKGKRKLEETDVSNIKSEIKKTKTEKEEKKIKKEKEAEEEEEEEGEKKEEKKTEKEEDTNGSDTKKSKKEVPEENAEQFKTCMLLAGLYTVDDNGVYKYTIITIGSETEFLQDIHERCPLFLSEKSLPLWLNPDKSYNDIKREVENEHIVVCNDLSKVAVTSWSTYVVSSTDKSKNSLLRYIKS